MRKGLLITILIILPLIMIIYPGVANSETSVAGGGIITEGYGEGANRIIFGANIFTDEDGTPSSGILQINFHNTTYDYLEFDNFDKSIFRATEITGGNIDTREINGDLYTFIRIEANGQLNGEDGWLTVTRFSDDIDDPDGGVLPDAVRIQIFYPTYDDLIYDTGSGPIPQGETEMVYDFPHDHSWRTFFDGGNITVFYEEPE